MHTRKEEPVSWGGPDPPNPLVLRPVVLLFVLYYTGRGKRDYERCNMPAGGRGGDGPPAAITAVRPVAARPPGIKPSLRRRRTRAAADTNSPEKEELFSSFPCLIGQKGAKARWGSTYR